MITPRPYQLDALNALWNYYASGKTGNVLIAHPTASGKSLLPAIFISEILKLYPTQRFLLVTHVSTLVEQNSKELLKHWRSAPLGIYSASLGRKDTANSIIYGTIQSMVRAAISFGHRDMVWVDEAHLIGDNDVSQYQKFIAALREINPRIKIVGMSATPYRQGMGMLTEGKIFNEIIHDLTSMENFNRLIEDGYLAPLIPKRTNSEINTTGVKIQNGDYVGSQLEKASDKITHSAIQESLALGYNRRCWMAFASGIDHAEHIADTLNSCGINCAAVHSKRPKEWNAQALAAWKNLDLQCVSSYSKLTTGINNPYVDFIIDLRPTVSVALHCLDKHTEILTKEGFKDINTISKSDIVSSVVLDQEANLIHQYAEIDELFKRELYENEYFITYSSFQGDWRVTNKHNMIVAIRNGREKIISKPHFKEAQELLFHTDVLKIPVSCHGHKNELPISDANLRFIGLVMTDGSLAKDGSAIIYQSERYPSVLNEIRKCISESGMKFGEYVGKPRPPHFTMHRFQVAFGKPRSTDKHLTGWAFLSEYMSKDFAPALMNLSERQFDVLLEAIHWGDGTKQSPKLTWIRRSHLITTGNKLFANRLQQVAIINGYKCNIKERTNTNGNPIILVTLKKKTWLNVQKSKDGRDQIEKETPITKEIVWCIENKNQTIITRRNGIVTIMGNCQKLGRGTRIAEGKVNCLVGDFAKNVANLGCINDPRIPNKKGTKTGDIPVKICDSCGIYNHISARFCGGSAYPTAQGCGEPFSFEVKIVPKAGTLEIIKTDTPVYEIFEVDRAEYEQRQKDMRPAYIRCHYYCGLQRFSENIFPEAKGYGKHLYHQWWLQKSPLPPPATAIEALKHVATLRCPKRIRVHVNLRYPEITGVEY